MNQTMPYNDLDLIKLYKDTSSGHFFDKDTMRFFRSRITTHYRRLDDKRALFITTEQWPSSDCKRMATVRIAEIEHYERGDGRDCIKVKIGTLGDFNKLTLYQAKKIMNEYKL